MSISLMHPFELSCENAYLPALLLVFIIIFGNIKGGKA